MEGDDGADAAADLRRRLAEVARSEARYRNIFDELRDPIVVHDPVGNIVDVNPSACMALGYTRAELGHMVVHDIEENLREMPRAERGREWAKIEVGETRELEASMLRKDGTTFPADVRLSRFRDADDELFVVVCRDISQRKRNEAALERYREHLEDEVRTRTLDLEELNTALERARDDAEGASRAKSQFLANMSHELRTPLNAIIGYSEMMQEDAAELGATELDEDLKKIHQAGRHLLELIGNILDLSKIEAGKMEVFQELTDLSEVAHGVAQTLRPLIEKAGNALLTEGLSGLGRGAIDVTKVRQILFNLLSNANKFTTAGTITLSAVREARPGGSLLRFSVTDTGVGMSQAQLDRIFVAFTQADASTTRKYGGTGLGLALSRHLARMLGGDIRVISEEHRGTTFEVTLPLAATLSSKESSGLRSAPELASGEGVPVSDDAPTVLVIDDDPDMRALLDRFLRKEGYRPLLAASGEEGLELVKGNDVMAITLDVMMPGLDGWAVLGQLKADEATSQIPVIFLTMVDDRGLAFGLGAAELLQKPIDRRALAAVLRRYRCDTPPCDALIIDDEPAQREILRRTLTRAGWMVREAENGRVALERVREHRPSLILLDLMMPELDGFGFLDEVKRDPNLAAIPVVVLTAKTLTTDDKGRLSGAAAQVFEKGAIGGAELMDHLRRLLQTCEPAPPISLVPAG